MYKYNIDVKNVIETFTNFFYIEYKKLCSNSQMVTKNSIKVSKTKLCYF